MSGYPDDNRRGRSSQAPYPPDDASDYGPNTRRARQPQMDGRGGDGDDGRAGNLPPPPMGEALRPALKREGSRSRLAPGVRPEFNDSPTYQSSRPPDLESKNHQDHRKFRDKRDGYTSDEGQTLRQSRSPNGRRQARGDDDPPSRARSADGRRPRGPPPPYDSGPPPRRRRDPYDDYDDRPPPRPRRDRYDDDRDDYDRPRRRRDRPPEGVEYGSDPIPARRRNSERNPPPRRRRDDYDDYDDDDDYDRPRRRHRSVDDHDRRRPRSESRGGGGGRRSRDDRGDSFYNDRHPRRGGGGGDGRRRYSDDDYSDRDDRDRRRDKQPRQFKIGDFDVGPLIDKGQKFAPYVAPIVINMARQYLQGGGGSGSGSGKRR